MKISTAIHSLKLILAPVFAAAAVESVQASPVSIDTLGSTYTQDFNTLAASGTSSAVPTGWSFYETGSSANATYRAGSGTINTGDTYSFGASGSSDRAFGILRSGSLVSTIGAEFQNNLGQTIGALEITYVGEQWRLGAVGRGADTLTFEYSLDASSLQTGTWTPFHALDFASPATTGTVGALDGNAAANRTWESATLSGLSLATGSTFWLRWSEVNPGGAADGLAVDDFSLQADGESLCQVPESLPIGFVAAAFAVVLGFTQRLARCPVAS